MYNCGSVRVVTVLCTSTQVMKDQMGNTEAERKSSYFERPWCQEAIPRYFYAKVSQRKSELEQALGIRHP